MFGICADDFCQPMCCGLALKIKSQILATSSVTFLRHLPFKKVVVHCFVSDIKFILESLSRPNRLEELTMKLSVRSNSPSLASSLESLTSTCSDHFKHLTNLTLDSSNLQSQHIQQAGRALLLDILGRSVMPICT